MQKNQCHDRTSAMGRRLVLCGRTPLFVKNIRWACFSFFEHASCACGLFGCYLFVTPDEYMCVYIE